MTDIASSGFGRTEREGVALCLSGGGYRAMLFHLGALRRLNEIGWLSRLNFVSSVSGGSITAAQLALSWSKLTFINGVATNLVDVVDKPLRGLATKSLDARAIVGGMVHPRMTIGDLATKLLDKYLFHGATLQDLPDTPRFIFNATNLQTGSLLRFSKKYLRDYRVARVQAPKVSLARAVAASAAFPPVLSPVHLDVPTGDWDQIEAAPAGVDPWPPTQLILSDGGVYDNLGLETVYKRCATILVSDGGGQMQYAATVASDWLRHLRRVLAVVDNQVRDLRKRRLIEDYQRGEFEGAYWGIRTDIADYRPGSKALVGILPAPLAATRRLAAIPTRLTKTKSAQQDQLINWGYAAADAAMRTYMNVQNTPAAAFPCSGGVGRD